MTSTTTNINILITDDDENNRANLIYYLNHLLPNAVIAEAADGEIAIRMVTTKINEESKNYDLIFMDYKMPGINGEETTNAIRRLEANLENPSIIITWSSAKNFPYQQADDVMQKPARKQDVKNILHDHKFIE